MSEQPGFFDRTGAWMRRSLTMRIVTIVVLILLLLIPLTMVQDLIREREWRKQGAIDEVSGIWGGQQTIAGPVISVPYDVYHKVITDKEKGEYEIQKITHHLHILPDELHVTGKVEPELRHRGIYDVVVYKTALELSGSFSELDELDVEKGGKLRAEDAFVSIGIPDVRSIQEGVKMQFGKDVLSFGPGVPVSDVVGSGISAPVPDSLSEKGTMPFSFALELNGSSGLRFVPMGKETTVHLDSPWSSPKFDGAYLPDDHNAGQDNADGFFADWRVLHLNRNYPQRFVDARNDIHESAFGLDLIVPVDEYQKSTRAAKYGVMLITLTFLVFFFVQVLNKVRIHPVQYLLVGLALCIFYTLLIAIGEHLTFSKAYIISTIAVIGLVSLYAKSVFKDGKASLLLTLTLLIIFGFIFTIVQLEDLALLIGSIGLFIALAIVMMLSRKIDWYRGTDEG